MTLYKNKYRSESARLGNWDYGSNATYFVTICTGCREWYFGDIINDEMIFSDIGEIAYNYWTDIPKHFPLNQFMSEISPKPGTLSTIIRSYKSACTTTINDIYKEFSFSWHPRFHDHIIRDNESYERISNYIKNNPKNWENDELYKNETNQQNVSVKTVGRDAIHRVSTSTSINAWQN